MADTVLLKNVRPRVGEAVDVLIEEGRFQHFGKNLGAADAATIDGRGLLMLPGLIESHVHLDKTLRGLPWRPNSAGPRLVAFETATTNNARALGLHHYGLSAGNDADFVLVDCETLAEAVVGRPRRALVGKRGWIVARDGIFLAAS
jgi:cytosine/adenosine deaminase-related metal-dependent hydrolase